MRLLETPVYGELANQSRTPDAPRLPVFTGDNSYAFRGLALYQNGLLDSSRTVLLEALEQDPSDWRVYYLLALIDYRLERYEAAERIFQTSLVFCPDTRENRALVYSALGLTLEQEGELGRAKQHFLTALNLDPESETARDGLQRLTTLTSAD